MENNWKNDIGYHIANKTSLMEVSSSLKEIKLSGLTQDEVKSYLYQLRQNATDDDDRILEILDIVEGYCNEKYLVW